MDWPTEFPLACVMFALPANTKSYEHSAEIRLDDLNENVSKDFICLRFRLSLAQLEFN